MRNRFGLSRAEREALASADVSELRGIGSSELAVSVRTDERVRAAAAHLLARLADVDAAVAMTAASAPGPENVIAFRPRPAASAFRRASVLSGGLVAAAIAAIVLYRDLPQRRTPAAPVPQAPLTATINASSPRPFAVIPTDNPDIAIVWLFNKEMQ